MNKFYRPTYLKWLKWFAGSNLIIFYLLACLYLRHLPTHVDMLGAWFLLFTLIGHIGLLCLLVFILPGIMLWLWPRFSSVVVTSVVLTSLGAIVLFIDVFVFNTFSFHINFLLLKVIFTFNSAEFFGLSLQQTILSYAFGAIFIIIEIVLANLFWQLRYKLAFKVPFYYIIIIILSSALIGEGLYAYAYATGSQSTLQNSRAFPAYIGTQANDFFIDLHLLTKKQIVTQIHNPGYQNNTTLNYPLHALQLPTIVQPPNIVIIGIDAWRADMLQPDIVPSISAFAQQASVFHNHYSGGNATLPGIYTLYYAIPSVYWDATDQPPVFFKVLQKYHYDEKVYFSAGMQFPPFYRNVFLNVHDLRLSIPGKHPYQRDAKITEYALNYLGKEASGKKPFFMFLFYDAAHSNSLDPTYPQPFVPIAQDLDPAVLTNETNPVPYLNLYKDALYYDDHLIGQVLAKLRALNLLQNTVVIITSDHGQEFNDNHKNYWGHVSNFTRYQTQVPLIIYLPGRAKRDIYVKTSHYDLLPTILQTVFKVKNPLTDYSIGNNLFNTSGWQILPEGSYNYQGLIAPPYIYNFYPMGVTAVYDMQADLQKSFPINAKVFHTYLEETNKFYKKNS